MLQIVGAGVGALVGAATTLAALRMGSAWLAAPLVLWGAALVAASCCDAVSQRVPTALVRQAIITTGVLLTCVLSFRGDWDGLLMSVVAAAAAGSVALLCWRFADVGFGDVRLAVLGGLGLGHATHRGLLIAVIAMALVVSMQATITVRRGGSLKTPIAFGPILSVGFLIAAVS
ncbi:peptidase [Modestobacter altitudinis]|uniref:peptidase n=1 Tax=Modestobacter altitudinis TaxID=2213158 RepID=UPI00110CE4B7|nr:peptidase [Modestobacter altitudinis]